MTMLTMRCRIVQNELVEGEQEQQAAEHNMVSLQQVLQCQRNEDQASLRR